MSDTLLNPYFGEFGGMYVPEILVPVLKRKAVKLNFTLNVKIYYTVVRIKPTKF